LCGSTKKKKNSPGSLFQGRKGKKKKEEKKLLRPLVGGSQRGKTNGADCPLHAPKKKEVRRRFILSAGEQHPKKSSVVV